MLSTLYRKVSRRFRERPEGCTRHRVFEIAAASFVIFRGAMRSGQSVAVVVPAYNEAERVPRVVARIPAWVDLVIVVDDGSRDATAHAAHVSGKRPGHTVVVRHDTNRG